MTLENSLAEIKKFLLDRYGENLAGVVIFGSVNTGHFLDGESDIDHMIFLKELGKLDIDAELKSLNEELKQRGFASQYFNDLKGLKDYIMKRKSFSTYITVVGKDGSRTIYTTPEFERVRTYLRKHPLTKKEIQEYVQEKDAVELEGYFKDITGYMLAKQLMFHIRRKLQILNYFRTGELVFDYHICLGNATAGKEEKKRLEKLFEVYKAKRELPKEEADYYANLARELTKRILRD